ncbi:DUF4129 domain-containing protein [Halomicroarcula sp. F13]|uniref:DUF4129 domain-containing protein n=1 Tax=Haloarcula rubra TaxID=2487747 RepID=A0AAW4PVB3_9EURY|nr:DUF4129 domain-containing protein [Halomicroarcula rubra]MBX0324298.1 DUF4129 domain-containing protein [Halomicroarcula rubra]
MNQQHVITILFAGCCLFAAVSMAASLETSVPGNPDDVVDVDTESLPLPSEQADQVKNALQSGGQSDTEGNSGTTSQPSSDGSQQGREPSRADSGAKDSMSDTTDGTGQSSGGTADSEGGQSGLTKQAGLGPGGPVDSLLDLLRQLFERLLAVVAVLAVLGMLALAGYKRDLLLDRLREYVGRETTADVRAATTKLPNREPRNEIERTWLEMVSSAGAADDPSLTPRERAEAVAQTGLRSEPVRELTDLFEDVRYGDRPVTTSEVREASAYLRRSMGQRDD